MQESAYVVIISVLLIDDIQFMIILIPNYETFMAMIDNVKCPDGSTSHRHEEVVRQSTLGFCPSAHRWQ